MIQNNEIYICNSLRIWDAARNFKEQVKFTHNLIQSTQVDGGMWRSFQKWGQTLQA